MSGWPLVSLSAVFLTSAGDSNNNPLRSKKSPLSSCDTVGNRSGFFERACASALVARSAFSEVVAFTTTRMPFFGKALDNSSSR